jgi:hypothetical protein
MEKKINVLGIDIAKQVFHLVGRNEQGTILLRKRLYLKGCTKMALTPL